MATTKATTPKRAGSLTFPSDPLAAMRELSDLDAPTTNTPKINAPKLDAPKEDPSIEDAPALAAPEKITQKELDQSYDNMTNKLSSKLPDNQSSKPSDLQTDNQSDQETDREPDKQVRKKTSQPSGQSVRSPEGQPAGGLSVAALIRQRASKEAEREVLKTVTLKISPTLDERIERYCFENKLKKQDFWAEAAALYFETVEGGG